MPKFDIHRIVNTDEFPTEVVYPQPPYRVLKQGYGVVTTITPVDADDRFAAYRIAEQRELELTGLRAVSGDYPYMKDVWRGNVIVAKLLITPHKD